MSDWHFGMDYDMWLYPPVDWMSPDYNYELPEPIEAANIEGTLLVNAEDAIEQVRHLQADNDKLRKAMDFQALELGCMTDNRDYLHLENEKLRSLVRQWYPHMLKRVGRDALKQWGQMDVVKELGIEEEPHVDD